MHVAYNGRHCRHSGHCRSLALSSGKALRDTGCTWSYCQYHCNFCHIPVSMNTTKGLFLIGFKSLMETAPFLSAENISHGSMAV